MVNKIKLSVLLLIMTVAAVYAYDFDSTIPVKGASITDSRLQSEMIMPIYYYSLRVAEPDCQNFAITDTEVSKTKENNMWSEVWTVQACTRTAKIPVNFTQGVDKTDFAIDYMNVKVAK